MISAGDRDLSRGENLQQVEVAEAEIVTASPALNHDASEGSFLDRVSAKHAQGIGALQIRQIGGPS
jgi:hypothetical protein